MKRLWQALAVVASLSAPAFAGQSCDELKSEIKSQVSSFAHGKNIDPSKLEAAVQEWAKNPGGIPCQDELSSAASSAADAAGSAGFSPDQIKQMIASKIPEIFSKLGGS